MASRRSLAVRLGLLIVLVAALDAATKAVAIESGIYAIHYVDYGWREVLPLVVVCLVLLAVVTRQRNELAGLGLALFAGGNLGNIAFLHGAVPDWIYVGGIIANAADVFIAGGAVLLALGFLSRLPRRASL